MILTPYVRKTATLALQLLPRVARARVATLGHNTLDWRRYGSSRPRAKATRNGHGGASSLDDANDNNDV